jgi:hypothetical protein
MSLTELALLDGRRPLPLGDVIGLTLTLIDRKPNNHFINYTKKSIRFAQYKLNSDLIYLIDCKPSNRVIHLLDTTC